MIAVVELGQVDAFESIDQVVVCQWRHVIARDITKSDNTIS
jgi:hypothetical protein